jgi:hypothetical protein
LNNSLVDLKQAVGGDVVAAVHHDELSTGFVAMIGSVVVAGPLKVVGKRV